MKTKRATVYFHPRVHRALRLKAAASDASISDLVNDAVEQALLEDAEDARALKQRAGEPDLRFSDVVKDFKRRGKV
jgi:hypothetical protein